MCQLPILLSFLRHEIVPSPEGVYSQLVLYVNRSLMPLGLNIHSTSLSYMKYKSILVQENFAITLGNAISMFNFNFSLVMSLLESE